MDRKQSLRTGLSLVLAAGAVGMVVAIVTDSDQLLSLGAAVVCLLSAVAVRYSERQNADA